jgi:hypothetical protein
VALKYSAVLFALMPVLLGACEDLHNPKNWAMQRLPGQADQQSSLQSDMVSCDQKSVADEAICERTGHCQLHTDDYFAQCMRIKGWSVVPAFAL